MPPVRALILLAITASCGRHEAPRAAREDAAAPRDALRFDRREERVSPVRWAMANIADLAFCPGDKELVTIQASGWLMRWNVADGTLAGATSITARDRDAIARRLALPGEWRASLGKHVDCGPDGSALVQADLLGGTGDMHGVLYRVEPDGTRHAAPGSQAIEDARFLPDGSIRVALAPRGIATWNGEVLEPIATPDDRAFSLIQHIGHGGVAVTSVAPTPSTVGWSALVADQWISIPGTASISAVEQAPDGAIAAIVERNQVKLWTLAGGKLDAPKRIAPPHLPITLLAAGDRYIVEGTAHDLWKVRRTDLAREIVGPPCAQGLGGSDQIAAIALAHDGHTLAVACARTGVRLLDLDHLEVPLAPVSDDAIAEASATGIAWSPSGKLAFGWFGSVQVRDGNGELATIAHAPRGTVAWLGDKLAVTQRGQTPLETYEGGKWLDAPALPFVTSQVAVAGDTVLAVASSYGKAAVVRGNVMTTLVLAEADNLTDQALALAPDGSRGALVRGAGSTPAQLVLFDIANQKTTELPVSASAVAITKDQLVLAAPESPLFHAEPNHPPTTGDPWGAAATAVTTKTFGDWKTNVFCLALSRDGVLAAGGEDGRITVWRDDKQIGVLDAHVGGGVTAVAWAPDGHHLASAGPDGAIVWDLSP